MRPNEDLINATKTGPVTTLEEERITYLQRNAPEVREELVPIGAPVSWSWNMFVLCGIIATVVLSVASSMLGFGDVFPQQPEKTHSAAAAPSSSKDSSRHHAKVGSPGRKSTEPVAYNVPNSGATIASSDSPSASPMMSASPTPTNSPTTTPTMVSTTSSNASTSDPATPEATDTQTTEPAAQTTAPNATASDSTAPNSASATANASSAASTAPQ